MSPLQTFARYTEALDHGDLTAMEALIDDDFRLEGAGLDGIGKREFLGAMKAQLDAFRDCSENPSDLREVGEVVHFVAHVRGTQTGTLGLPGIAPVLATGRRIELPPEPAWLRVKNSRLLVYHVDPVPGGGVHGILSQLKSPSCG